MAGTRDREQHDVDVTGRPPERSMPLSPPPEGGIPRAAARVVQSDWFTYLVFAVIVVNAAVIGAETYKGFEREHHNLLVALNDACLAFFVFELGLRILAFGRRPQEFFKSGWNVFDFVIIGASFVPGLGQSTTALRLIRLLRVVRLVSLLPGLRVLLVAVGRSIPPVASVAALAALIVYVYAVIGWLLFHDDIPDRWGDVGTGMLNLFVMLSLENLPQNLEEGMKVHGWSWIYFVSFALMASFLLLNLLIGIIINSMEEARQIEHARERAERRGQRAAIDADAATTEEDRDEELSARIATLRDALESLEDELAAQGRDVRAGGLGPAPPAPPSKAARS
jgi:voltage-gated sodium channel